MTATPLIYTPERIAQHEARAARNEARRPLREALDAAVLKRDSFARIIADTVIAGDRADEFMISEYRVAKAAYESARKVWSETLEADLAELYPDIYAAN